MTTLKFCCDRDVLVRALATVGRGVGRSGGDSPVLSGVKFDLEGGRLLLTATDLTLTIQVKVPVAGKVDGVMVVPARLFGAVLRSLEPGQVAVAGNADAARILMIAGVATTILSMIFWQSWGGFRRGARQTTVVREREDL